MESHELINSIPALAGTEMRISVAEDFFMSFSFSLSLASFSLEEGTASVVRFLERLRLFFSSFAVASSPPKS